MLFEGPATALVERVAAPIDDDLLLAELRRVLAELRARGVTGVHNIEDAHSLPSDAAAPCRGRAAAARPALYPARVAARGGGPGY